jgi:phosphoglycerol transferase MdoB-like AlkP superfamily enzyme
MYKNNLIKLYTHSLLAGIFFLILMSISRLLFFIYFNPSIDLSYYFFDILQSFLLGFRLDLTIIGYLYIITFFSSFIFAFFKTKFLIFYRYFYLLSFIFLLTIIGADFGFFSYFKEHINILFFGLFDDDTKALIETFIQNYNVIFIILIYFLIILFAYFILKRIFAIKIQKTINIKTFLFFLLVIFIFILLITRGGFGMYPLGKMSPSVSSEYFINQNAENSIRSFIRAYKIRKKFQNNKYNLIERLGYKNNIQDAFKIHSQNSILDTDLLQNITYTTKEVPINKPNVVVIMVESFGLPILKYNTKEFNLLRNMEKHFKEELLFTHFISSGDGTIPSLESLLLNITNRPASFSFAQSSMKQTAFSYSPAFVYKKQNYQTNFIYGGDLGWRDIGSFVKHQGYDKVEGKLSIFNNINKNKKTDFFHPWGIYDEYLFEHIYNKLNSGKKPKFIFALTTNNHPPYVVPKHYHSQTLHLSKALKNHLTGDLSLAKERFYSYQYAIDQVGIFLDKIKNSPLRDNTIVAITADNNTLDGIMRYDDNILFQSKNIPFLLYLPTVLKNKYPNINLDVASSHKDIFPTLYNLSLNKQKYIAIGSNLLNNKITHYGFNSSGIITDKNQTLKINPFDTKNQHQFSKIYRATLGVQEYLIQQMLN